MKTSEKFSSRNSLFELKLVAVLSGITISRMIKLAE